MNTIKNIGLLVLPMVLFSLTSIAQIRDGGNDDFIGGNLWQTGRLLEYTETTNGVLTRSKEDVQMTQLMSSLDWYEDFIFHFDVSVIQGLIFSGTKRDDGSTLGFHSSVGINYGRWFNYDSPIQMGSSDLVIGGALVGEVNWIAKTFADQEKIDFDHYTPGLALYLDYKVGDRVRLFNITEHGRLKADSRRRWSNQTKGWVRLFGNFGLTAAVEYQTYRATENDENTEDVIEYSSKSLLYQFGIGAEF